MISTVLRENGAEKYMEQLSGLSFKIELAGADNQQNFEFLNAMNDVSLEKKAMAPKFSFCLGLSKKFEAIAILFETVIASGFDKATIQAYWDGFPMDAALIEKMSEKETELLKYKEYLQNKKGK